MTEETKPVESKPAEAKKEKKAPPKDFVVPPKKPKLSKAERRALQEAQRSAKASGEEPPKVLPQQAPPSQTEIAVSTAADQTQAAPVEPEKAKKDNKMVDLFRHLPQFRDPPNIHTPEHSKLHPAVLDLGIQYFNGTIRGGNSRCRSMLQVFLQVLEDYHPPTTEDFRSHLDSHVLKPSFAYWTIHCRPHSVSMGNAFTFCKTAVASLDRDISWEQAKELLVESIEQFMQERLDYADQAIAHHALSKIEQGDVLLTFGNSQVISVLLETAKEQEKDFFVWVVDSRPLWEGKELLTKLEKAGISCGYINLNALTYVMSKVTKVFLGASALMSNGSIFGRVGTACVALLAQDHKIPVLVCCETYKISNRVQLESITYNEVGDPNSLTSCNHKKLDDWKETPNLKLLNLLYDVTPSEFVSGIVTEVGIIPPSSVAVLLREMNPQDSAYS